MFLPLPLTLRLPFYLVLCFLLPLSLSNIEPIMLPSSFPFLVALSIALCSSKCTACVHLAPHSGLGLVSSIFNNLLCGGTSSLRQQRRQQGSKTLTHPTSPSLNQGCTLTYKMPWRSYRSSHQSHRSGH